MESFDNSNMDKILRQKVKNAALEYFDFISKKSAQKKYIPASGKKIGKEELCNMIEASLDMWLTAGRFNDEFEREFAKKLGARFALSTNSGSSANLLALTALTSHKLGERALRRGDEVIAVAAGFPTTINPIIQNGLVPVFIDAEIGTYNIDVSKIEEAIGPKTKAIFLAHTLGNTYDLDKILEICTRRNLWLIEDSCDALGAKYKDKYAGTYGHIGTFSFYPAHHITMGEGGALVTSDSTLYRIIMSFRDWGRDCWCKPGRDDTCRRRFNMKLGNLPEGYDHKYTYSHIGYNLKITDWQAAIACAQLKKLDEFLEIRRRNAECLMRGLSDMQDSLILPEICDNSTPSWFGFLISVKDGAKFTKQELVEHLEQSGIGTRQLFAGNILRQPMFVENDIPLRIASSGLKLSSELSESDYAMLPNTDFIMNNTFWVGCAQNLEQRDVEKTVSTIRAFVEARR